ncbi:SAF domain-containing protein [Cutibacterium equinum]|uniref:SAF domain-containing protein n=1 Tax=Cutibacterium equinum TaxID=3016342 RepID=A0ABY7R1R3_9ACTN|nr:SAF domain-containing protein [Cutibacterium equinum]WCC81221.1 SAF domain-containing protein [Cutibacterium equinum]
MGGAFAWHSASHTDQVLVMTRAVRQGEIVRNTDVGLTSVSVDRAVTTIPASRLDEIVGRHALVDLSAGQLLGSHSVGEVRVGPGRARVGLKLAAGRLPAVSLPAGAQVTVVETSSDKAAETVSELSTFDAVVVAAPKGTSDHGGWLVDIEVDADSAAQLADLASLDRIALVERGR